MSVLELCSLLLRFFFCIDYAAVVDESQPQQQHASGAMVVRFDGGGVVEGWADISTELKRQNLMISRLKPNREQRWVMSEANSYNSF